jgi:hypothetical protein
MTSPSPHLNASGRGRADDGLDDRNSGPNSAISGSTCLATFQDLTYYQKQTKTDLRQGSTCLAGFQDLTYYQKKTKTDLRHTQHDHIASNGYLTKTSVEPKATSVDSPHMLSMPSDLAVTTTTSNTEDDDTIASVLFPDDDMSEMTWEGEFYYKAQQQNHHQQPQTTSVAKKGVSSWTSIFRRPIKRNVTSEAVGPVPSCITVVVAHY